MLSYADKQKHNDCQYCLCLHSIHAFLVYGPPILPFPLFISSICQLRAACCTSVNIYVYTCFPVHIHIHTHESKRSSKRGRCCERIRKKTRDFREGGGKERSKVGGEQLFSFNFVYIERKRQKGQKGPGGGS